MGTFPVYSLTIWEWRLSLRPERIWSDICRTIWSDNLVGHLSDNLVGHLSDNFKSEVRQNSVSDLSVWSLIHLEGSGLMTEGMGELGQWRKVWVNWVNDGRYGWTESMTEGMGELGQWRKVWVNWVNDFWLPLERYEELGRDERFF